MYASLQNIWRSPVRKTSSEFSDIFRQENPKFSRYFRVNILDYSFYYPAIFLSKSAVNRWENGWYSLLIGVFQQQKIALKEVFLQRQCVSFHFPRTGKCIENAWKPHVVRCSRVGQRKEIWCFLAFVSCLRVVVGDSPPECSYSHAFLRSCHSIIVRKMVLIPILIGVLHR